MSTELLDEIVAKYRAFIEPQYPSRISSWPIVSGCNRRVAELPGGLAIILDHTGAYPPS